MPPAASPGNRADKFCPPIIVIGAHRSGTTMVAESLSAMGLFMGKDLVGHHESYFFEQRNDLLLKACNGGWDNPEAIVGLWQHPPTRARISQMLRDDLKSAHMLLFLGPGRYRKYRSAFNLDFPWGWKDPRNSILLPLWLEIFPQARVIHVLRNGVDVAASLARREEERLQAGPSPAGNALDKARNFRSSLRRGELPFKLFLKTSQAIARLTPLHRYRETRVQRCLSREYGFELWAHYVACAHRFTATLPPEKVLNLRYEDLLLAPAEHLLALGNFCGLTVSPTVLAKIAAGIKGERAFAFRKHPELVALYQRLRNHPLMQQSGYDKLETC